MILWIISCTILRSSLLYNDDKKWALFPCSGLHLAKQSTQYRDQLYDGFHKSKRMQEGIFYKSKEKILFIIKTSKYVMTSSSIVVYKTGDAFDPHRKTHFFQWKGCMGFSMKSIRKMKFKLCGNEYAKRLDHFSFIKWGSRDIESYIHRGGRISERQLLGESES